jgi:membrane peptidoglycan carboxypeptidase
MGGRDPHGGYGIVAAEMQTSLQRRQRHRRNGAARRGRGGAGGTVAKAALAIPIILFASFLVLGAVGFVGAVSAYAYYSRDLPDPKDLFTNLAFDQPSVVLDRTGLVQLAQFGEQNRELVLFGDIPGELIDATTSIEDKDFWSNPGFDLGGFISATIDTLTGRPRGGSTITQQLVRARLLPQEAFSGSVYDRKIREIIQSIRLTQAFPGEDGKKQILTAYLNQNFYGNQSYGIKAAALGYFDKELKDLTLAEAAILAAIPQSPSTYDLVRNSVQACAVDVADIADCPPESLQLVVPASSAVVQRRNQVLQAMETRSVLTAGKYTVADYDAAMKEPVVLSPQKVAPWKAAQFVWKVRDQVAAILCGPDIPADECEKVDRGGYTVVTTLNYDYQQILEKWLLAAARAPQLKTRAESQQMLQDLGIPKAKWNWILNLRGKDFHNDAGSVLDYITGEVLAYAGSAGYDQQSTDPGFQPQYDVWGDGWRQPGSAMKPMNYALGFEDRTMTPATVFMDVVTDLDGKGYTPQDAEPLERGPVRLRNALQFSLNIPALKAVMINGVDRVFAKTKEFGLNYQPGAGPVISETIGTLEIHMADLLGAFGTFANGGVLMPRQMIVEIRDAAGNIVYEEPHDATLGKRVVSEQTSFLISNILEGNTKKTENAYWAVNAILENGKTRRPATFKTGTTDDRKDVTAFGYLAPQDDPSIPSLAVGVWMGNSDAKPASTVFSTSSSGPLWSAILTEISQGMPMANFTKPSGIVQADVDAYSGLLPGPYTTKTVKEYFIDGTVPQRTDNIHVEVDIDQATGLLWQDGCTGPRVTMPFLDFSSVETAFPQWQSYTQEWALRAAQGPGTAGGPKDTATSYFYDGKYLPNGPGWGGNFAPTELCQPTTPPPNPCDNPGNGQPGFTTDPFGSPVPCPTSTPGPTNPNGGGGGGGGKPTPTPSPLPS